MMRQLSSSGLFGGGGLKSKMLRKMTGMPDMAGFSGDDGEMPQLPQGAMGGRVPWVRGERNTRRNGRSVESNERCRARARRSEGGTIC